MWQPQILADLELNWHGSMFTGGWVAVSAGKGSWDKPSSDEMVDPELCGVFIEKV
jgi:hypothetical protein